MNQPRVTVEIEDHWFVLGEQAVKVSIAQTMRMLALGQESEQIDDINETNFQIRKFVAQKLIGGQCFLGGNVASACKHNIRFAAFVIARPSPDAGAAYAMLDCRVHVEILQM